MPILSSHIPLSDLTNLKPIYMIFFKPMPVKTVESAPVKMKVINVPKAPRLVLSPSGTLAPVEDILDYDFDKRTGF